MKQVAVDQGDALALSPDLFPGHPGEWHRDMFANNACAMIVVDPETGLVKDANAAALRLYEMDRKDLIGSRIGEINTAGEAEVRLRIAESLDKPGLVHESLHRTGGGRVQRVAVSTHPFRVHGSVYILSSIDLLGASEPSPREREALLKNEGLALRRELDHRVRNNLQFLHSLIGLERKRDPLDLHSRELERLEGFVGVIANVYESAMDNERGGFIDTRDLFELLLESEGIGTRIDREACRIEVDLGLRLDQAISIGLLFKLMLFNATEGAGKGDYIIFKIRGKAAHGMAELEIEDNLRPSPHAEAGAELLTKAATAQISASLGIRTKEDGVGTVYSLKFPLYRLLPLA